jgi:hypothetical protein
MSLCKIKDKVIEKSKLIIFWVEGLTLDLNNVSFLKNIIKETLLYNKLNFKK